MAAPIVGAWIEISIFQKLPTLFPVAPIVGAWIEISAASVKPSETQSLLSWERGLKSSYAYDNFAEMYSRSYRGSVD